MKSIHALLFEEKSDLYIMEFDLYIKTQTYTANLEQMFYSIRLQSA